LGPYRQSAYADWNEGQDLRHPPRDSAWKFFLDIWSDQMVARGVMQDRYDHYLNELAKG